MKRVVWILVSCLMALSLVMASCGPAEEEAEVEVGEEEVEVGKAEVETGEVEEEVVTEEKEMVTMTLTKLDGTTMQRTK
jgi:ABC-type metal ion transport system substrate-binding protein